jgi:hypothetical protein
LIFIMGRFFPGVNALLRRAEKFPDSKLARRAGKNEFVAVTDSDQPFFHERFLALAAPRSAQATDGIDPDSQRAIRHGCQIMNAIPRKEAR